ncbi:hypothetical protein GW17_00044844 [Ensete ventricosum]|nr:hypothetical protein GW17_00044844 [Ensete ventricosum]
MVFSLNICSISYQVIAESLSEEEIAGLREMFTAMDTDNSGAITFDELKAGLRRYGSTLKDTEIRDLMEADGRIDYGEFVAMMRRGTMGLGRRTMRNTLNISMRDGGF